MSARLPDDPPAPSDLSLLVGPDEARAQEAFARLWALTLPAATRQAGRLGLSGADAEDVAQAACARLWRYRRTLRAGTPGEWYALVRTTVARVLADHWAASPATRALEDVGAIPDGDLPYLDALLAASDDRARLYGGADSLWLGDPADPDDAQIGAAALALALGEGVPPEEAASALGAGPGDAERWLADPAVVARALFAALCWPGEDLSGHVLRPGRPMAARELDGLPEAGTEAWPGLEARVVLWRARNGLREDQILTVAAGALDAAALDALLERFRAALPFREAATRLAASLGEGGRGEALQSPGLWRRIAFEYATRQELPHRQIVERAGPPAREAGVRLDAATLNNWLSMGRLYAALAARLAEARP